MMHQRHNMMDMFHRMSRPYFIFNTIITVLVIVLLVYLIKKLISKPSNNALKILDERYARGEISKDEYLEMKNNLQKKEN